MLYYSIITSRGEIYSKLGYRASASWATDTSSRCQRRSRACLRRGRCSARRVSAWWNSPKHGKPRSSLKSTGSASPRRLVWRSRLFLGRSRRGWGMSRWWSGIGRKWWGWGCAGRVVWSWWNTVCGVASCDFVWGTRRTRRDFLIWRGICGPDPRGVFASYFKDYKSYRLFVRAAALFIFPAICNWGPIIWWWDVYVVW